MRKLKPIFTAGIIAVASTASAAVNEMVLQTNRPGAEVQPTMYGLFFEDINFAADGGLYAEMVKNRSFEFPQSLEGWTAYGHVEMMDDGPFDRNSHYVRLSSPGHSHKHTGLENEGFFGVAVKAGETYKFSVWARTPEGGKAKLKIVIADTHSMANSQNLATATITVDSNQWKRYTATLTPNITEPKAKLRIFMEKPETASVDLEHISLFPTHLAGARQRSAPRPGTNACRPSSRHFPFPRRLHCGRNRPGHTLPMEKHRWPG